MKRFAAGGPPPSALVALRELVDAQDQFNRAQLSRNAFGWFTGANAEAMAIAGARLTEAWVAARAVCMWGEKQ